MERSTKNKHNKKRTRITALDVVTYVLNRSRASGASYDPGCVREIVRRSRRFSCSEPERRSRLSPLHSPFLSFLFLLSFPSCFFLARKTVNYDACHVSINADDMQSTFFLGSIGSVPSKAKRRFLVKEGYGTLGLAKAVVRLL
jgi:hypothetical protein